MRTPHQNDLARYRSSFIFSSVIGLVLACGVPAFAQTDNPNVARLSFVQGNVAVQRGDAQQNVAGTLNAPLLAGDALTTGADGRAEVQYDGTSMIRVASNAQVRFANLDPNNRVAQLAEGTVNLDVLNGDDGSSQVDTPSISVRAAEAGRYRVTVTHHGDTLITVRAGRADILLPQDTLELTPGSTLLVQGSASNPSYHYIDVVAYDSFDSFNAGRDQQWLARIGPDDAAYSAIDGDDLDAYGQWVSVPDYGTVWSPYQTAGWAPYRYGQWAWEDGYGWTWVSSDPWGWAPYHYGRWFHTVGYGWCWYPPAPNPFWAPALVGFISFGGPGFNISLGFGNIGWVPLAPWEAYHPWWGRGYGYGPRVVNITNINIYNNYRNARYGGFTGVDARHWRHGNFSHNVAIDPRSFNGMHVQALHGALPIAPTSANLRFSNHALPATLAARRFDSTEHFAGRTNMVSRTPFVAQRSRVTEAIAHPQFESVSTARTNVSPSRPVVTNEFAHTTVAPTAVTRLPATRRAAVNSTAAMHPAMVNPPAMRPAMVSPPAAHTAVFPPQTTTNNAWARFNQSRGLPNDGNAGYRGTATSANANADYRGTTYSRRSDANVPQYAAPAYSRPTQQYTPPVQSYSRPAQQYSRPVSAYSRPAQQYSRPVQSYSRPVQQYSRPNTYVPRSSGPPPGAPRSSGGGGGNGSSHSRDDRSHPH